MFPCYIKIEETFLTAYPYKITEVQKSKLNYFKEELELFNEILAISDTFRKQ
jgi:hypothetical protein